MLTQRRLREVLHYNPATGLFTFVRGRRKGKIAGTTHDDRGFLKVAIDTERHFLHRLAWLWMTGEHPRWNIEHINRDPRDNRWVNLREGDRIQKSAHRAPWRAPTGTPGIWQVSDRFEATVVANGAVLNLGDFSSEAEARAAMAVVFDCARRKRASQRRLAA